PYSQVQKADRAASGKARMASTDSDAKTTAPTPSFIYKILHSNNDLPTPLPSTFILPQTSLDIESGFIHFSTSVQVPYVLNRFFNGPEDGKVWLVKVDYARLAREGNVRWEVAGKEGSLFAHLYEQEVVGGDVEDVMMVERCGGWDDRLRGLKEEMWLE
ncbi:MAG: hypothetical protein Q9174_005542, partial [Haloplaca sp. 1 TL-2023]